MHKDTLTEKKINKPLIEDKLPPGVLFSKGVNIIY